MVVVGYERTGWWEPGRAAQSALVVLAAWVMAGCGAGVAPGGPADAPAIGGLPADGARAPGGFSVFAEPSPATDDLGQAKLALSIEDSPGGVVAVVGVCQAQGLKAVLAGLRYDASRWHPESAEFTQALATDNWQLTTAADVLSLAVLSEPGVVHLAQALAGYAAQPGLTAEQAVVARVRFSPGAVRTASAMGGPPVDKHSVAGLNWDYRIGTLAWYYASKGDGDQNGVVNLADMVPLAQHYRETYSKEYWLREDGSASPSYGAFPLYSIDGNDNTAIDLADLVYIARNFGASALGGYEVFSAHDAANYPAAPDAPNGSGTSWVAHVAFEAAYPGDLYGMTNPQYGKRFRADVPVGPGYCYWVRPVDEQGRRGTPSTIAYARTLYPPAGASNQQAVSWDAVSGTLSWYYHNRGDYDQNGIVVMLDIGMVAQFFNEQAPGGYPNLFPEDSVQSVVDGETNGVINLNDIIPVGMCFYSALTGYNVYASANIADYNACANGPSVIAPLGHVAFSQAQGDTMVDRLRFTFHLASRKPGWYYWVRPELWGTEGVESQVLQLPAP